jgi:hypothetical protein
MVTERQPGNSALRARDEIEVDPDDTDAIIGPDGGVAQGKFDRLALLGPPILGGVAYHVTHRVQRCWFTTSDALTVRTSARRRPQVMLDRAPDRLCCWHPMWMVNAVGGVGQICSLSRGVTVLRSLFVHNGGRVGVVREISVSLLMRYPY